MLWTISVSAVTAYLVATFFPTRRAADLLRRAWSRVRRELRARAEQTFAKKSAHIPHHKPRRR
jgi:hypothetical protein